MKLEIRAPAGLIGEEPDTVVRALADVAAAEGADRDDWLTKAARAAGAATVAVPVSREPRFQAVGDARQRALVAYDTMMRAAVLAVQERLERAARDPQVRERYRSMARPK